MSSLIALIVGPLLAAALGVGAFPAAPPPVITIPPTIHLSMVGGGVQAGQSLKVQAVVTAIGGIQEKGTVTFWVAGSSMKVGSVLDASSTAVANLGPVTTTPITVDASFVPAGSSTQAATAEATFRASAIPVTPFVTVGSAVSGSPVSVHYGLSLGPSGYVPGGHVDVMIGILTVRSAFCVLAPGGGTSAAGVWECTATIPSLPAGNVELHVVLADSPYYSSSKYVIVPVAAAPVAHTAPKASGGGGAATPSPTSTATSAATGSDGSAVVTPTTSAPEASVDGTPASSTSSAVPNWLWIVLLVIALAAVVGAGLLVVRVVRRPTS